MRTATRRSLFALAPVAMSALLVLVACGGGPSDADSSAQSGSGAVTSVDTAPTDTVAQGDTAPLPGRAVTDVAGRVKAPAPVAGGSPGPAPVAGSVKGSPRRPSGKDASKNPLEVGSRASSGAGSVKRITRMDTSAQKAANAQLALRKGGATDLGVTKDAITMGTVSMHGISLGNLLVTPLVNGVKATFASINERGGVLGRRLSLVDCDDGVGDVARSKACIKQLVEQDKVFALLGYSSWASASVHADLARYKLPAIGTWGYSQSEWQDPYMFPTHMSTTHEAIAGANWVRNVIKPKTYGLICLTSPEMQLACAEAAKVLNAAGVRMVSKLDLGLSETAMSAQVLAMRAANPDHILHFVANPATMANFMVGAAQQGYYPPMGISGNRLAAEVLGSLFGKQPVDRYWTNTPYRLWGPEFMAVMNKYARDNRGLNHHLVQAGYVGALIFQRAATAVGPNLTRQRLMAQLANGDIYASDSSLDQRFAWTKSERFGTNWDPNLGQGREFMYKYTSTDTASDPNGTPSGFAPDPDQFVITTSK